MQRTKRPWLLYFRRARIGILAMSVAASLIALVSVSAAAHPAPSGTVKKVAMTFVCTVDPTKVRPGESLAQLCPNAGSRAVPQDTVTGACGDSYLYIWNIGNGLAAFEAGADSDLGPIQYGSATVSWLNASTVYSSSYNLLVTGNLAPNSWYDWQDVFTGPGDIVASMGGDVLLTSGQVCQFLYPYDDTVVT